MSIKNSHLAHYLGWDADFATTAYRQHVEALAQQQVCYDNCIVNVSLFLVVSLLDTYSCSICLQLLDLENEAHDTILTDEEGCESIR